MGCGWWSANQRGKLSVGVNLKVDAGVQVVRDLAAVSHIAIENFSSGVADRLGVGAAALQAVNPELVYASLSAFGATGPHAHWIGYGTQLLAASGMARAMMGGDERCRARWAIPYPDPLSGLTAALGVLAAVGHGGARLDGSMLEATCLAVAGSIAAPDELADRGWSPEVVTAADGAVLLTARPHGAPSPGGATASSVVDAAHAGGGDAVTLHTPSSVLGDERLAERAFWRPDLAPRLHAASVRAAGPPFRIDGERPAWWRGAPDLFEDTTSVLRDLVGYGADEIESLVARGAVATRAGARARGQSVQGGNVAIRRRGQRLDHRNAT